MPNLVNLYNIQEAEPDKLLQPDGSIITSTGIIVSPANPVLAVMYANAPATVDKWYNSLGEVYAKGVNSGGGDGNGATNTSLLTTLDPISESLSGIATKQNIINQENKTAISNLQTLSDVTYGYANSQIDVVRQYIKTDEELIDLFGVISSDTITVNQASVDYGIIGVYDVIFTFTNGVEITLKINIVPLFDFELRDVKKYATQTAGLQNFIYNSEFPLDFSDYNIALNGAPAPSEPSSGRFEWNGVDIELLKNVVIEFNNVVTLSDGTVLKANITPIRESVYGTPENFNQSIGVIFSGSTFEIIQRNFNEITFKMTFYDQVDTVVPLENINILFRNIQAGKFVGSDIGETQAYTSLNTLLLGDEKLHPKTNIPVTLFGYEPYDLMNTYSENNSVVLIKKNSSSIIFTIGKEYTGLRSGSFSSLSWEAIEIGASVDEIKSNTVDSIYGQKLTATPVSVGGNVVLISIPSWKFQLGKQYEIRASAKYTRSSGGTTPSNVGFRIIQGTTTKIDDIVSVERDATTSLSMNIPQIVSRFSFNNTQNVIIEAYVPAGQQDVTIDQAKIRFTEVNEIQF